MNFRGFVQAGGGSTRFGTDKALVHLAGKSMLRRTGELLAGVCDDVTIVAPAGRYPKSPWPVLGDRWPGEGPLGGILTALHHARESIPPTQTRATEHVPRSFLLILSCDMPFLTHDFLAYLRERAQQSSALVVVPESASGLEPLCACWRMDALATVQAAFDAGVRKVTEAMKHLSMEVLDESVRKRFDKDDRLFWNMNTPADFEAARRLFEASHQ